MQYRSELFSNNFYAGVQDSGVRGGTTAHPEQRYTVNRIRETLSPRPTFIIRTVERVIALDLRLMKYPTTTKVGLRELRH